MNQKLLHSKLVPTFGGWIKNVNIQLTYDNLHGFKSSILYIMQVTKAADVLKPGTPTLIMAIQGQSEWPVPAPR